MRATNEVSVGAGLDNMLDAKGSIPPMRAKTRAVSGWKILANLLAEERRDNAISGPSISQWPWVEALTR